MPITVGKRISEQTSKVFHIKCSAAASLESRLIDKIISNLLSRGYAKQLFRKYKILGLPARHGSTIYLFFRNTLIGF